MVSFVAEPLFFIGVFPFTNTFLDTLLVDVLILLGVYFLTKKRSIIPNYFQNSIEFLIETFYNLTQTISPKHAAKIFPYFMTFFLVILLTNLSGLLPGFSTIGFSHDGQLETPLLRSASSDINFTLGLALISAVATHAMSIRTLGLKEYFDRYFSLNPIYLFVGFLEIVSEITKVVSLSFRLFGNIFAGEVVLATISQIFAFILPLPFLFLEIIVGLVQALVFALLTMTFMAILTTPHHPEHENEIVPQS